MTDDKRPFKVFDRIRDHAGLGGEIIVTYGDDADRVKVRWDNGHYGLVKTEWLRLDPPQIY